MKLHFLDEPELEFGNGRHIDVRFGIMNYGPLDYDSPLAPKRIKLGVAGTAETVEGVEEWLTRCRQEIPAKASNQPNLFPRFPGFRPDACFDSELVFTGQLEQVIPQREVDKLGKLGGGNAVVEETVNLFADMCRHLVERASPDVLLCAVPMKLLDFMEHEEEAELEPEYDSDDRLPRNRQDFHDLLKARAMALGVPVQVILPMTYDATKRRRQVRWASRIRQLQDEATRAWNLHVALYYKAGGRPWRIPREATLLTTCYLGIGFYKSLNASRMLTSVAQVFNERGEGIILRGGRAELSREDRQPHLRADDAKALVASTLQKYRDEHRTLPARVVVHKTSKYNDDELQGIDAAVSEQRVDSADLIVVRKSSTRLFRDGAYPPLRGTLLSLDDRSHILYTRGSVGFFATYPGMYVPRPQELLCERAERTPRALADEVLALTKMNWNSTQFDGAEPITIRAARQVGDILRYVGEEGRVDPRYAFYM